jgi:uncharacterized iron-regulated protein
LFRLIGNRGIFATPKPSMSLVQDLSAVAQKGSNFGKDFTLDEFLSDVRSKQVVFFGEMHEAEKQIALQKQILLALSQTGRPLHVVMEHFSVEMQTLLDMYSQSEITLDQLYEQYKEIGTEGHNILAYKDLLEYSREHPTKVKLHGGFLPRTYARMLMKEGEQSAIKAAVAADLIPCTESIEGSDFHYNMFESMITQRDLYDESLQPTDQFRNKMFKA